MIHLNKDQLKFLKSLYEVEKFSRDDISDKNWKMLSFLDDEKLIKIHHETIRHQLDQETGKFTPVYGIIESVSISERGKAYLSERKYNFKALLLKDVFVPIIVTLITNLLLFGAKELLPLIQGLLSNTPE